MKAALISPLMLLCMLLVFAPLTDADAPCHAQLDVENKDCAYATTSLPTHRTCVDNEKRPANQLACTGKPFGQQVSYPGNCSLFLVCDCEYPTVKTCPGGLWFNQQIQICDWPKNVLNCNNNSGSTEATTNATPTTLMTATNPIDQQCDTPPGMSDGTCKNYADGILLRYPYNCNAYVNCTQGCAVLNFCIPGKVFNAMLMICDTPDTAKCTELNLPTTEANTKTTAAITMSTTATTSPTTTITEPTIELTTVTLATTGPTVDNTTATIKWTSSSSAIITTTSTKPTTCAPLSGIAQDICAVAPDDTLQRYPYDCNTYINCYAGCAHLKKCAPGTVYNELLMICDTPDDDYCTEEPMPTTTIMTTEMTTTNVPTTISPGLDAKICKKRLDGSLLPHASDCESFIECEYEKPILRQCPEGWLFNSELLICDEPKDVHCYSVSTTELPKTSPAVYQGCVGQPYNVTFPDVYHCQYYHFCWGNNTSSVLPCPPDNWYNPDTGNCGPTVSPVACQEGLTATSTEISTKKLENVCENAPDGASFPDKSNCQQYIFCIGGVTSIVLKCPINNYFNPATGNCGPDVSPEACQELVTSGTTPSTTHSTTQHSTTTLPQAEGACGNNARGEILPYPQSCTKYIVCRKSAPIAFYCPNNLYYNAATQTCDLSEDVNCTGTTSAPGAATTSQPITSQGCDTAKVGDTVAYTANCQFYVECLGGNMWMLNSCAWNENYDALTQNCSTTASTTACRSEVTTATPELTTLPHKRQGICYDKDEGERIAYPHNCSKFIICQSPIPVGHACAEGLEFNMVLQVCVAPVLANCSIKTTLAPTTEETTPTSSSAASGVPDCKNAAPGAVFTYPIDCSKYLICMNEEPKIVPCMPGTYYNPDKQWCDRNTSPTYCFGAGTGTTPSFTTWITEMPVITTEKTTSVTDNNTSGTTHTTAETTVHPLGPCYGEPDGMLVSYPQNCTKYIICLSPIAVGYDCPAGLEFNSALKECDSPETANCGSKTTESIMTTPTITTTPNAITTPSTHTTPLPIYPNCSNAANGQIFANPTNCKTFIVCLNSEPMQVNCLPGTHYNPLTKVCDSVTSATACTDANTSTTTSIETTIAPEIISVCKNAENGKIFPNPRDCGQYIVCTNGQPFYVMCMPGEHFNPLTEQCDRQVSPTACKETPTYTTTTTATATTDTTLKPTIDTTTTPTGITPPIVTTDTITHSPTTPSIITPTTATTPTKTTSPIAQGCQNAANGQAFAYPQDCTQYILCMNGLPMRVKCMPGTYYNPLKGACGSEVSPTACKETPTTPPTPTLTTATTPTTQTTLKTTPTSQKTPLSTTSSTTIHPLTSNVCCDMPLGTELAYPGSCDRYIVCDYPVPIVYRCRADEIYDISQQKCVAGQCHQSSSYKGDSRLLMSLTTPPATTRRMHAMPNL